MIWGDIQYIFLKFGSHIRVFSHLSCESAFFQLYIYYNIIYSILQYYVLWWSEGSIKCVRICLWKPKLQPTGIQKERLNSTIIEKTQRGKKGTRKQTKRTHQQIQKLNEKHNLRKRGTITVVTGCFLQKKEQNRTKQETNQNTNTSNTHLKENSESKTKDAPFLFWLRFLFPCLRFLSHDQFWYVVSCFDLVVIHCYSIFSGYSYE